jgi:PAS domain S-box-containing protein
MTDALRLFLIEDDDDIALLIRKSLERVDHQVTRCRNAADALIVLGQHSFDLVLLDQRLPDMTGLDLLRRLGAEGVAVPVLMVTAWGDEHLATRVLQAGALDYIVKDPALTFLGELPKRVSESVRRHRLEQMNRLLIQALESARDGVVITDLQGTILEVNRSLENMTGYTRAEMIGQTPRLFKSGVHPPEFYAQMWRAILGRSSWQGELTNRRKDGALRITSMTISPIVDPQGRLTHFVGIQRDVTEHKQLERQLLQAQKMQSVGTLAGGVAHEFNNLLAGINGYAALGLREEGASTTLREFLEHIVRLSERAAVLTRQLLAFARKPALVRQRLALPDLVRSTADLVTRTLHQEVRVDLGANHTVALLVHADANQLQQALVNLALNARDALLQRDSSQRGQESGVRGQESGVSQENDDPSLTADSWSLSPQPTIVFRLRHEVLGQPRSAFPASVPPGDWLVLEVEDSGVGMTTEVRDQALDPFFTTKEVGQGTGLGLPMVFGIVQGHGGHLVIDTTAGVGTTMAMYLPRQIDRPIPSANLPAGRLPEQLGEVVGPEEAPGRSILVIDDEEAVLDVVARFLRIAGHQVTCASSGADALALLGAGALPNVDLVVLDLMMPREDAAVTFERLRRRCPGVPVLLCTGLAEADPAPQLLRLPDTGLIRKPFRMNELWYAVRNALAGGGNRE